MKEVQQMKNQTYVILTIIFIIIISIFAVLNIDEVKVNYLFWSGSSPLVFVILFSVLLGGVLTMAVGSMKYLTVKRENKRLREMIRKLEMNIDFDETTSPAEMDTEIEIIDPEDKKR